MNVLQRIIEELSQELNFKYQFLSKDWITMIEKDNKTRYFAGYKFDLNNQGLGTIVDDKYALYDVLSAKNLPTIEYKIVYNENNQNDYAKGCNNLDYVKDYLRKHHEIVLKPNNGTCGHDVIRVSDEQELETIYHRLLTKNFSINMSPFYHIEHEYRVVILNNKVKIIYQKNLPIVIGDGKSTIRELLIKFNPHFFSNRLKDEKYDRILSLNERFEYNWKFNLSQGSTSSYIENPELKETITNLAIKIASSINLHYGSIDIIRTTNNELLVMEINSGIMVDNFIDQHEEGYKIAKDIYREAIITSFNE